MENKIDLNNDKYPALLKVLGRETPKQLYYKGEWPAQGGLENCLAVVGSRRMTTYGRQITEKLVGRVAAAGITIVSGFMYGIDATAHQAAVDVGGRTIAVMPCGIERIHPEYQVKLYNDILENGGLIISEYEGDVQPGYWTYPARNRIVAGISKATLVVEAGEKSGSLITARLTQKFERKLFAVPGPLISINSFGTNGLIKEGKAEMVLDAGCILKFFNVGVGLPNPKNEGGETPPLQRNLPLIENQIIDNLKREPVEIDILARKLNKDVIELSKIVSLMEIRGAIKNMNGKYYVS